MSEQIKQIAARLRGLRDVLELTEQEVADACQLDVEEYREMEAGTRDLSVSTLQRYHATTALHSTCSCSAKSPR